VAQYGIREIRVFRQLARYDFSNFTKEVGYHSWENAIGMKSAMSSRSYAPYMEETNLVFELFNYQHSLEKQYAGTKRFLVADKGI